MTVLDVLYWVRTVSPAGVVVGAVLFAVGVWGIRRHRRAGGAR